MARNSTLKVVRSMVKSETGKSLATNAAAQDSEINQIIANVQQWLASEFDWPYLRSRWDVTITPGTRYISFPTVNEDNLTTAINFERAGDLRVYVKWNDVWQEVNYGINEEAEYNYIDSDTGQVLDPIQRWAFDDENKFEVWPLPASTSLLRFVGQRVLTELRTQYATLPITWNDSATLDLDDLMVTYFAAGEYMTRANQAGIAKDLLARGAARMAQIRLTYPHREKPPTIVGGGSTLDRRALRIVPLVVVGGK
jgi:hypothetical protein